MSSLTDKEYYQLTISVGKALNSYEAPVKAKHVRTCIILTYHSNGGHAFWAIAVRQPLQENRITAWKFCHVLHKLMREGHPLVPQHSMRHRAMITEMGKLWGHLNDGYGLCIKHYTKLLVTKLNFHDRNPRFPGNLSLQRGELDQIAGNDINNYFQLAVEMFDYLDDIVALQATIFNSITTFHVSSMTAPGQCRLAPLIPCVQDSNQLYDFVVRIMFRLHASLPDDLLTGHRDRFRTLFIQLKNFYNQAKELQYFVNLITVPSLPLNPPNFLVQSDLGNYTTPVVVIPGESESDTDSVVDNLVDTSAPPTPVLPPRPRSNPTPPPPVPQPSIDHEKLLQERDDLIRHLQTELSRQTHLMKAKITEQRESQARLEQHIAKLNSDISNNQNELSNIRIEKQDLELKLQSAPNLEQKAIQEEEKAKQNEEKFQKLKAMYMQTRTDHINLLKKHSEQTKELEKSAKQVIEVSKEKEEIKSKLDEIEVEKVKVSENLQQSSEVTKREKEEMAEKLLRLEEENANLMDKYQDIESNKSAEIAELKINLETMQKSLQELRENSVKLEEEKQSLEKEYQDTLQKKNEIDDTYQEALVTVQKLQAESEMLQVVMAEKAQIETEKLQQSSENSDLKTNLQSKSEEIETLKVSIEEKCSEILSLHTKIQENEESFKKLSANYERVLNEKEVFETDIQDLLHQQEQVEAKHNEAMQKIQSLENDLMNSRIHGDAALRSLLEACIKTSEKLTLRAISDSETPGASGTATYFIMIAEELQDILSKLKLVHENYLKDNTQNVEALARKVIVGGHLLASVHEQGMAICNKSPNIDVGERTANEIKEFGQTTAQLFQSLYTESLSETVNTQIDALKDQLYKITNMIGDLTNNNDNIDAIGDMVEKELAGMDKAIEEAAQKIVSMLAQSRASDEGIKLEVNEKILDACTNLMRAIQILVQKSRLVQAEIIALGKGTASAKEFYKRNHQWTEGLISAAKSVAQGANFLVDAANKAVTGVSKHQLDIIVAAQEIAACTAQLVVASRVKAPSKSQNLQQLTTASKGVTQATGAVVATAKNCSQRLEEEDLDFTKMTLHQSKTKEMEVQVKVLELEQALQVERMRLAALRRKNYQEQGDDK